MRNHEIGSLIFTGIITVFMILAGEGIVEAVELNSGVALRQNVLLLRWPSGMEKLLSTDCEFGISETRMRLFTSAYRGKVALNAALETRTNFTSSGLASLGGFQGEGSLLGQSQPLERWDITKDHIEESTTTMTSRIDRLDITWRIGTIDVNVGRQPLSLGTSHFVGILDVVAPFAPGDLDVTYKPGVDAVRVRRGIGMTGECELIAVGAKPWSYGALLGRFRSSFKGMDLEFVGGRFRRRSFGGIGWEGEAGPMGLWGEVALFQRRKAHEKWRGGWSEAAFSGVAGVDVSLADNFTAGGALMFQDFGARDPEELMDVYSDAPYREGWVFLGSASYAVVTLHRLLHPLVNGDAAGLINLIDGSTLWQPRITISTGDNSDLSIYGWIGTGEKPEADGILRSEFGMMPDGAGFYARWFF